MNMMGKIAARKRIKNHINRYGNQTNFTVTPRMVKFWWNKFNCVIFDNKLTFPDQLTLNDYKSEWGSAWVDVTFTNTKLYLNHNYPNKKFFLAVLLHEMVHIYQAQILKQIDHGKSFLEFGNKIKRLTGLSLQISM